VPEYYRGSSTAVGGAMAMRWNKPGEVEYSGVAVAGAGDAAMGLPPAYSMTCGAQDRTGPAVSDWMKAGERGEWGGMAGRGTWQWLANAREPPSVESGGTV
jgi:hypothetical protein